jgi:hypothetical protein
MKQITIIIGLPGSGKSHLLEKEFSDQKYTVVDDPMQSSDIPSDFPEHLVIADCRLCRDSIMTAFHNFIEKKFGDVQINKIYFENNPEQCLRNVAYRNDGRLVHATIEHMSKTYHVPDDARVIPVFDTDKLKKKNRLKL